MAPPLSLENRKWSPALLQKLIYEASVEVDEFLGEKYTEEQKDWAKDFIRDLYHAVDAGQELPKLPDHEKMPGVNTKGFHCMMDVLNRLTSLSFMTPDEDETQMWKKNGEIYPALGGYVAAQNNVKTQQSSKQPAPKEHGGGVQKKDPTRAGKAVTESSSGMVAKEEAEKQMQVSRELEVMANKQYTGSNQAVTVGPEKIGNNASSFPSTVIFFQQEPCGICRQIGHHTSLCPLSRCRVCLGVGHMTFRCPMAYGVLPPTANMNFPFIFQPPSLKDGPVPPAAPLPLIQNSSNASLPGPFIPFPLPRTTYGGVSSKTVAVDHLGYPTFQAQPHKHALMANTSRRDMVNKKSVEVSQAAGKFEEQKTVGNLVKNLTKPVLDLVSCTEKTNEGKTANPGTQIVKPKLGAVDCTSAAKILVETKHLQHKEPAETTASSPNGDERKNSNASSTKFNSLNLLKPYGYKEGEGLGPTGTGITTPVKAVPVRKNKNAGIGVVSKGPTKNQKQALSRSQTQSAIPLALSTLQASDAVDSHGSGEKGHDASVLKDYWSVFKEVQREQRQQGKQQQTTISIEKSKPIPTSSSGIRSAPLVVPLVAPRVLSVAPPQVVGANLPASKVEKDSSGYEKSDGKENIDLSRDRQPVPTNMWRERNVQQHKISTLFAKSYPSSSSGSDLESPPKSTPQKDDQPNLSMQRTPGGLVAASRELSDTGATENLDVEKDVVKENTAREENIMKENATKEENVMKGDATKKEDTIRIGDVMKEDIITNEGAVRRLAAKKDILNVQSETQTEYARKVHQAAGSDAYRKSLIKYGLLPGSSPSKKAPQQQQLEIEPKERGNSSIKCDLLVDSSLSKKAFYQQPEATPKTSRTASFATYDLLLKTSSSGKAFLQQPAAAPDAYRMALLKYGLPTCNAPLKEVPKQKPASMSVVHSPLTSSKTQSKEVPTHITKSNIPQSQIEVRDKGDEKVYLPHSTEDLIGDIKLENIPPNSTRTTTVEPKTELRAEIKDPIFEDGDLIAWD